MTMKCLQGFLCLNLGPQPLEQFGKAVGSVGGGTSLGDENLWKQTSRVRTWKGWERRVDLEGVEMAIHMIKIHCIHVRNYQRINKILPF